MVGIALLAGLAPAQAQSAATSEMLVFDARSGLALYGFDPVAYFTDGAARTGDEDLEYSWRGVGWRFVNEGNRAAFEKDPEVYTPQFGGYDPVAVARGIARPGHPEFFLVHDQQLFLFYSAEARDAFAADAEAMAAQAKAEWPAVSKTLSP